MPQDRPYRLHIGTEACLGRQGLDLVEPDRGVVRRVIGLQELFQNAANDRTVKLGGELAGREEPVIEEGHVGADVLPRRQVLARLLAAAADGEDAAGILRVAFERRGKVRVEFLRIFQRKVIDLAASSLAISFLETSQSLA